MKNCCICDKTIDPPSAGYPQFLTDPKDPEMICLLCLPNVIMTQARKYAPHMLKFLARLEKQETLH